jgi:hypothetical protein
MAWMRLDGYQQFTRPGTFLCSHCNGGAGVLAITCQRALNLMVANAAAVIVARQNRYIRTFRKAGAANPERARRLQDAGIRETWVFRRMVRRGVFVEVSPGRYYLEEKAAEQFVNDRRARALMLLGIVALLFLVYRLLSTVFRGHL